MPAGTAAICCRRLPAEKRGINLHRRHTVRTLLEWQMDRPLIDRADHTTPLPALTHVY